MTVSRSSVSVPQIGRLVRRGWPLLLSVGLVVASCSDDNDSEPADSGNADSTSGGSAGMGMGSGGSAGGGMAGSGGAAGAGMAMGGSAGQAMGGAAGMGMGGSAGGGMGGNGMGGSAIASGGGTGILEVLNDDAGQLLGPTTAAIVDDTIWVAIGQLAQLFVDPPAPSQPFKAVSLPLSGGAIGSDAIEFVGADFFLEGIAASSSGELYLGTVTRGQIARVAPNSILANPFTDVGAAVRGVIGMTVDEDKNLLWYCDSNPVAATPGGALVGVSITGGNVRQEVVRHDLPGNVFVPVQAPAEPAPAVDAGAPDAGQPEIAAPAVDAGAPVAVAPFCNDVIVLADGDVLITDSTGRIFRIAADNALVANSAEVWLDVPELSPLSAGGFGANGLDIVGDSLIVANSDVGGLVQVDPASADPASTVRALTVTENGFVTSLCGPDGLASVPGSDTELVVVENGFCAAGISRIVKVTLDLN